MRRPLARALAGIAAALLPAIALAQAAFTITPASPGPMDFIQVHKRYGNEDEGATTLSMAGNHLTIRLQNYFMYFLEVPPAEVTVDVGRLPAGAYQVEVILDDPGRGTTRSLGVVPLTVAPRASGQPVDEFSDLWWNAAESGWGMNIAQHASGQLFATWFVYAADGSPQWYVMPGGQWRGPTLFEGDIYRTTGPDMAHFSAVAVTRTKVGTADLLFGVDGVFADFTIDGTRSIKLLKRQPF